MRMYMVKQRHLVAYYHMELLHWNPPDNKDVD